MPKRILILFCAAGLSLLTGCVSVGPDYQEPESNVPDAWFQSVQSELNQGGAALKEWWKVFNDSTLNGLIAQAAANNLDLKTATARIEQAAALQGVSASQYFPEIIGNGSISKYQATSANTPTGVNRRDDLYQAGLSMAWELDLWGRIRRSVESADASLQASVEDYRDIMVLLYSEIASRYINVRALQERIALAESNYSAQVETMELTKNRHESGLVPALDVAQAELNVMRTSSSIPPLKQQLVEEMNRLCVLVGEQPYALRETLLYRTPIPKDSGQVMAGVPAELLRRRPDIRRAERELAAQTARIGANQAQLYPTLALPGTLAVESISSASDLFDGGNVLYSFGPQVRWSIFDGRRIRSQVDAERAATKAALHTYEKTVLLALEEVEGSMSAYLNEKNRLASLEAAATSAQTSVEQVGELYKSGLTDFQNVLNMEQSLLIQQDQLAASRGLLSVYLVKIYKALGGGWSPADTE